MQNVSALRINDRFFEELGVSRDEFLQRQYAFIDCFSDENRFLFIEMLENAMNSGEEASCELSLNDDLLKNITVYNRVRFLAQQGERYIFYLAVENISERKNLLAEKAALTDNLSAIIRNIPGIVRNYEYSERTGMKCIYSNEVPDSFMESDENGGSLKLISDNFRSFVYYEDLPQIEKFLYDAVRNRCNFGEFKIRVILSNGKMRWVQINLSVSERKKTSVIFSSIIINIDKQILNENNSNLYLRILSDIPYGVAVYEFDNDNMVKSVFVNDRASKLFGDETESSQETAEKIHSLITKYDEENNCFEKFLSGEKINICSVEFKNKDGSRMWFDAVFQVIENRDSNTLCYAVFDNISNNIQNKEIIRTVSGISDNPEV